MRRRPLRRRQRQRRRRLLCCNLVGGGGIEEGKSVLKRELNEYVSNAQHKQPTYTWALSARATPAQQMRTGKGWGDTVTVFIEFGGIHVCSTSSLKVEKLEYIVLDLV
jgi:hypothetical protein